MNDLFKFLYHQLIDKPTRWYPLLSVYYLTHRCQFRCPYCSDGSGMPYHSLPDEVPEVDEVCSILREIRKNCDHVVITGGEPLDYPHFDELLDQLPAIRFKELILTTNGYDIEKHLAKIARAIDTLVFSLDTLKAEKADAWYGAGNGALHRILANIEAAAAIQPRKFEITISSVVTPDNIQDLYEVYEYADRQGFEFAACPQLLGVKAHPELFHSPAYREFFDFLIREKKRGKRVFGTKVYLEYMRDFRKFDCRPFTMLVVSPSGNVYYPCLEAGRPAGNILSGMDLHSLRVEGQKRFGPQPSCDLRCHSACALGFATLLRYPLSIVGETLHLLRRQLRGSPRL